MLDQEAPAKKLCGIYKIRCLCSVKIYVGSSIDLRKRFFKHRRELRKGNHHSQKLQRAWEKYGEEKFKFEILELCGVEDLLEREQAWLNRLRPFEVGYNICSEGRNRTGVPHSEATKIRIGLANKGKERSEKHLQIMRERCGHPQEASTRQKIGIAARGRLHSEETKKKIGDAKRGVLHTQETKEKISRANRGRQPWLGRVHSAVSKEKMRDAHLGSRHTPESYTKVVETNRRIHGGKTVSPETRAKISASKTGRKHSEETKLKLREAWQRRKSRQAE